MIAAFVSAGCRRRPPAPKKFLYLHPASRSSAYHTSRMLVLTTDFFLPNHRGKEDEMKKYIHKTLCRSQKQS
jgi:hypothetical protein